MITNQKQLDLELKNAAEKIILELCEKILECVQTHIKNDVYNYDPNKNTWYTPTFEFLDAFKFEGITSQNGEVSNNLFYDWVSMSVENWIHGNQTGSIDRRKDLAEILNVLGKNGNYDFRGKERNMFWNNAIEEINRNFDKWAKQACDKYLS